MQSIPRALLAMGMVLGFGLAGFAPPAFAEEPTTQPAAGGKILVLPFTTLNKSDYQVWLGRSIQQSLLADLSAAAPQRAISVDSEAPDTTAAIEAGRKAGAAYVVEGNFVTSGQELRLTGQVLDVSSGQAIAGLKATGSIRDVFHLEDQVAGQVRQRLALGPAVTAGNGQYASGEGSMSPLRAPSQPSTDEYYSAVAPQTYAVPENQYYYNSYYYEYPAYGSGYDYGYYGYPWGYPAFGFVAVGGFGHHHDFDHHGVDHRGFIGGERGFGGLRPPIGAGAGSAIITPSRGGGGHFGGSFGGRAGGFSGGAHGGGAAGGHR